MSSRRTHIKFKKYQILHPQYQTVSYNTTPGWHM